MVDEYYGMFVTDVAKGRGVSVQDVRGGYGQGRVVSAREAVAQGMADRVGTIDQVVVHLLAQSAARGAAAVGYGPVLGFEGQGLGLQAAQEPMPTTPQAIRDHLKAPDPGGHGMDAAKVAKEPDGFLQNTHRRLHSAGNAGHTHPGLGAAAFDDDPWADDDLAFGASAQPVHHTATSDAGWDGPANETNLPNDGGSAVFGRAYAWRRPGGDAETKAGWGYIHHEVSSAGRVGAANSTGCSTGIGRLNQRVSNMTDADRQGVYRHLAAHIKDAGNEPPALSADEMTDLAVMQTVIDAI
jgi:hypothetical protein